MARDKYKFVDAQGRKWDSPIGEDGKPLVSSVSKKKPTAKPPDKRNPYR